MSSFVVIPTAGVLTMCQAVYSTLFVLHLVLKCSYKMYLHFEELRLKEDKKLV